MPGAFVEYLTVFRSRLGAANIVLNMTTLSHLHEETLLREITKILDAKVTLDLADSGNHFVFAYLKDKSLVHDEASTRGRYAGAALSQTATGWRAVGKRDQELHQLPVFQTDLWMASPTIRSTVGVPTPKNAHEIVDLTFQLRLLTKGKATWTSVGHLIKSLRQFHKDHCGASDIDNPFFLGVDAIAFLRQIIELDGFLLRELVRSIVDRTKQSSSDLVTRDDVAADFATIVGNAVKGISLLKRFTKRQNSESRLKRPLPSEPHRVAPQEF